MCHLVYLRHLLHLKKSIDAFYTSPWFLAVFLHNNFSAEDRIYTTLKDELAKRAGSSALIAFGHRHQRSLGRIDCVIFEEAPNLATIPQTITAFISSARTRTS